MNRRIFIAINLPENLKKKLSDYQERWPELPIRWTKKDNLHITLLFIGSVADQEIAEICQISKEVALRHPAFSINLNKICYGPSGKMPPRMVWVEGERSEELAKLQKDLENSLFTPLEVRSGVGGTANARGVLPLTGFTSSSNALSVSGIRLFAPHITLGRIRQWEFQRIEPEERPEVEENISLGFEVSSIEVMESRLKRGGSEYTILESASLADSKNF